MTTYSEAGVSIDSGNKAEELIAEAVRKTYNAQVLAGVGAFGAVYSLAKVKKMKNPLLVSTVDGVGTKLKVASAMNKFDTVGADIVNHCSNDILAMGAEPLFFMDYIATSKLDPGRINEIVKGMADACEKISCPLVGGETAEMPGVYCEGEHDIVGLMVGVVEKKDLLDGSQIREGDALIGLPSNGLHTNGYSLARKVFFDKVGHKASDYVSDIGGTLGDELLKVHKSYSNSILALRKKIKVRGIAHITGGGLLENVPRMMAPKLQASFNYSSIEPLPIFKLIQRLGHISTEEMFHTFNMGVGLVIVVAKKDVKKTVEMLKKIGEMAWLIGEVSSK